MTGSSFLVGSRVYVGAAIIPVWAGIRVGRIAYRQLSGRNENDASAKHDAEPTKTPIRIY